MAGVKELGICDVITFGVAFTPWDPTVAVAVLPVELTTVNRSVLFWTGGRDGSVVDIDLASKASELTMWKLGLISCVLPSGETNTRFLEDPMFVEERFVLDGDNTLVFAVLSSFSFEAFSFAFFKACSKALRRILSGEHLAGPGLG